MTMGTFDRVAAVVAPLDTKSMAAARLRQGQLIKPPGSLGRLEELSMQLCGIAGTCPAPIPSHPAVTVFAADHGVVVAGVTPWPQSVTAQMVDAACAGVAAVSVLAHTIGARLTVVDVGVASPLPARLRLVDRKVRAGTADLSLEPAMTRDELAAALDAGASIAGELVDDGADLLVAGEMGIGNTTAAAAVITALTGAPADRCTGRGTGIDDAMLARKIDVVTAGVARLRNARSDARLVLTEVGGLEIAALAGYIVGGVAARVPVVVDGVITLAALLAAERMVPGVSASVIAGHRSVEPGASVALSVLGLDPLIDLGMRLGEASGACVAVPIVQAAAATLASMATFDDAAVSTPD